MPSSLFEQVTLAPRDPILGLNEAFNSDTRSTKVNLGVGVYCGDDGKIPLLRAVRAAEQARVTAALPRGYLPIDGLALYNTEVQRLIFGAQSPLLSEGQVVTAQALGGTGALRLGADLLHRINNKVQVLISDPSWENHKAIFESAGFEVGTYPYYDHTTQGLQFSGMMDALNKAQPGTIVLLHACCHNPTGVDPTVEQWREISNIVRAKQLVPFLDLAYQGFGDDIEADSAAVRLLAQSDGPLFVASSFSKSFSLYGERVGALSIVTSNKDESARVASQLKRVIRANYSNPPTHGASVVSAVLTDTTLRAMWEEELGQMRERIKHMRAQLVQGLKNRGVDRNFEFVLKQRGMFSYSGLTAAQVDQLREAHGIYAVSSGRICVAALNSSNINTVCDAISAVLKV